MAKKTPKTQNEIAAEVAALKALVGRIIPRTAFGDDNNAALALVIEVLEKGTPAKLIERQYGDDDERLYDAAMQAIYWRNGDSIDGAPSEDWASLVRE